MSSVDAQCQAGDPVESGRPLHWALGCSDWQVTFMLVTKRAWRLSVCADWFSGDPGIPECGRSSQKEGCAFWARPAGGSCRLAEVNRDLMRVFRASRSRALGPCPGGVPGRCA